MIDTDELINLIKERPILWNEVESARSFSIIENVAKAWREVVAALEPNFNQLSEVRKDLLVSQARKKWNAIKNDYKNGLTEENNVYKDKLAFLFDENITKDQKKIQQKNQPKYLQKIDAIDIERLFTLVKNNPNIWDIDNDYYKDKTLKKVTWKKICRALYSGLDRLNENDQCEVVKRIANKWKHYQHRCKEAVYSNRKSYAHKNSLEFIANKFRYLKQHQQNEYDDEETSMSPENKLQSPDLLPKTDNASSENNGDESEKEIDDVYTSAVLIDQDIFDNNSTWDETKSPKHEESIDSSSDPFSDKKSTVTQNRKRIRSIDSSDDSCCVKKKNTEEQSDDDIDFFKSLLPHLHDFTDDERLNFRFNILGSIKKLKEKRNEG